QQPGYWRYTTLEDPTLGERSKIMNANIGTMYGLHDIRGYESIIPRQYVDFMSQLAPQVQTDFNRVAPLYTAYPASRPFNYVDALKSPLLDLLNVLYVIADKSTHLPDELLADGDYEAVYSDNAVNIWRNNRALPRVYGVTDAEIDHLQEPEN